MASSLFEKSDPESDDFAVLIYGLRTVVSATIPSFIKRIATYSFTNGHNELREIVFLEDSQLQLIDDNALKGVNKLFKNSNSKACSQDWQKCFRFQS